MVETYQSSGVTKTVVCGDCLTYGGGYGVQRAGYRLGTGTLWGGDFWAR